MKRGHSSRIHPTLERAPGKRDNWVEASGGLPSYIERIAKHLHYDQGMTISRAIASAVSQVKRWSRGGGDVTPATRAKALRAVAQWEALKAKNRAKSTARSLSVPAVASPHATHHGGDTTVPVTASTDGPRTTTLLEGVPRTHAELRRAIAAGRGATEQERRRLIRRARQINALTLIPEGWLNLATPPGMSTVDLAKVPGAPNNWKHGYHPLNPATAMKYRKGYWLTPTGKKISAARTRKALGAKSNKAAVSKLRKNPKALDGLKSGKESAASSSTDTTPKAPKKPTAPKKAPASSRGTGRAAPELVPADGNPRFRMQKLNSGKYRVLDTRTGRSSAPVSEADAKRKMDADNATERIQAAKKPSMTPRPTVAERRRAREQQRATARTESQTPAAPAAPARRGNDDRTVPVTPARAGSDGALFGLPSSMRDEQKARIAALPKGWSDANPGLGPAAKLARGNEITRTEDDVTMTIRAKPDGSGYTWRVQGREEGRTFRNDRFETTTDLEDIDDGEAPNLGAALRAVASSYKEAAGKALPGATADAKRFADTKPPKLNEGLRAAGAAPPPQMSDAQRRRRDLQRMTPEQRRAHIQDLNRRALNAKGGSNPASQRPQERARYQRLATEARKIHLEMERREREAAPAAPPRPAAPATPSAPSAPARTPVPASQIPRDRALTEADFQVRDLVPDDVRDRMEMNRKRGVAMPDRAELEASNRELHEAERHHYTSHVGSPGSFTDEQKRDAQQRYLAAARRAEQARKKYADQAASDPAPDSTHKTPRSAATAARKRFERDRRPVFMVATGDGSEVRLTGEKPRSGPYAELLDSGGTWSMRSGTGKDSGSRHTQNPGIGGLRPQKVTPKTFNLDDQHKAKAEARRIHDMDGRNAYVSYGKDGKVVVSDQPPSDGKTEYATYFGQAKWTYYPTGRDGVPPSRSSSFRLGPPPSAAPTRSRSSTQAAPSDPRVEATQRAQSGYVEQEYGLTAKSFAGANTPVSGMNRVGERAFSELVKGNPSRALSVLRDAAHELRTGNYTGSDRRYADRIDKVAESVEKKLRKPKNTGAALVPVGGTERTRQGLRRRAVDQTGREWTVDLNPDTGQIRVESGRLSGSTSFTRGDQASADRAMRELIGNMIGTRRRREGRVNSAESMSRETRASERWANEQAEYRRLRAMDATGQSDDNRAQAVVEARTQARNMHSVKHGVSFVAGTQGTNSRGRPTAELMDSQGGQWNLEYDRTSGVFWLDGPNGRSGSARVGRGEPLSMSQVGPVVSDLLEGKRRRVRNSDQLRSGQTAPASPAPAPARQSTTPAPAATRRTERPATPDRERRDTMTPQERAEANRRAYDERQAAIRAERRRTDPWRPTDAEAIADARAAVEAGDYEWARRIRQARAESGDVVTNRAERDELNMWGSLAGARDLTHMTGIVMTRAREMDRQNNPAEALRWMEWIQGQLPSGHERADRVQRIITMLRRKVANQ